MIEVQLRARLLNEGVAVAHPVRHPQGGRENLIRRGVNAPDEDAQVREARVEVKVQKILTRWLKSHVTRLEC
jgi:hypothetical protein